MAEQKRAFLEYCRVTFAGFAMGIANVIPGVSGGTMAFILGIFEELIDAIGEFASVKTLKLALHFKVRELYNTLPWRFLLALGIGIIIAFAGVTKLMIWLLDEKTAFTYAFFLGLILASIFTVFKKVGKWGASPVISAAAGAVIAYCIVTLVPMSPGHSWWILFLCGIIVICAMILPGISGSFLLLIFGQYTYVWGAIGDFSTGKFTPDGFSAIFWIGAGAVLGLAGFVHLLKWLFAKQHDVTVAALIGFMAGSLPRLWPWQDPTVVAVKVGRTVTNIAAGELTPLIKATAKEVTVISTKSYWPTEFGGEFWGIVGLAVLGFAIVIALELWATSKEKKCTR
ncbi:MAG: DUF368 domain-containing protein [Victivallaceae bacterium]|nr:DUF368 domain-containing protein [Victivallaceae bacterium]